MSQHNRTRRQPRKQTGRVKDTRKIAVIDKHLWEKGYYYGFSQSVLPDGTPVKKKEKQNG